jgi:hypothetical protein
VAFDGHWAGHINAAKTQIDKNILTLIRCPSPAL